MTLDQVEVKQGSAVFQHCCTIYTIMQEQATAATYEGHAVLLFEGFVTKVFEEQMGLSNSYYSQVMNELIRMGCIKQVRRGGGTSPSRWALLTAPTYEDYREIGGKAYVQGTPKSSKNLAAMTEMYRDMQAKVERMREDYNTITSVVLTLTSRVNDLETQMNERVITDA